MKDSNYFFLILFHIAIGVLIYIFPPFSLLYTILILIGGLFIVLKSRNRNNEVLFVCSYIVGTEVFLRMSGGNFFYEFAKYAVIFFMLIGIYFSSFSKRTIPFWIYLLLLVPGIVIASETLNLDSDLRKQVAFNITGPVCLGIASIYCFYRRISVNELNNILLAIGLPIISTTVYLILYTPELSTVLTGTGSNFKTSGGFGPNQVATALGLGMFIFFSRLLLESKTKLAFTINLIITFNMTYRGLVTFSRGGMVTGFVMILTLIIILYIYTKGYGRMKLISLFIFMALALGFTWIYTSTQTGGLIDKRYANQDASGRTKKSKLSGREKIWDTEIDAFFDSPLLGVGVGRAKEIREESLGEEVASHSEISRTLAEHGALGIMALLIVLFTPLFLYIDNKQNIYLFCFLIFWLLTINHAAMRIAAPAFIYSLSLLKVSFDKPTLHE